MISQDLMAPIMFGGLIVFLLIGYPAAFSLGAVGLFFSFIGIEMGMFQPTFLQALPDRVFGILSNDLLLSIPFFTFMGAILEKCGLAEDMLEGLGQLFGPIRGGLAYAVIIVGAILGAITGTVAASVIAMGLISLPVMLRYGYNPRVATGVIAASGTITQLIPPSLVLIVLADQLGKSVGDMYAGAIGPSIIQVTLFCLFIFFLSIFRPQDVPALPPEARPKIDWKLLKKILWGIVPSIALIFLVLGTILMGLATPTEGGAMGSVGALVLAAMNKRLQKPLVWEAMTSTMRINAMVIFILIGSTVFGQAVDSAIFYPVAFYGIWQTQSVVDVMVTNWALKVLWEILLTPVTYAVVGDAFGYWNFFPGERDWGVVPMWGHAVVTQSRHPDIAVGERVYGYLPMSTLFRLKPGARRHGGPRSGAGRRATRATRRPGRTRRGGPTRFHRAGQRGLRRGRGGTPRTAASRG